MLRSERGQIQASDAGSLVSGHRRWENDGVTQSLSETTGAPSIAAGATAGVPRRGGILRPGDQMGVLSLRRPSSLFARNIPLGCGVGMMGWRVEERDAPSVPDPLTAARRRRSSRRHFPPNVRCSPDCGLWRQDQAERGAMGAD